MLSAKDVGNTAPETEIQTCQTIFFPGITCSQSSMVKYTRKKILATTNQILECFGRNNLQPIDVLIDPFIGVELQDVELEPFKKYSDYVNPITVASTTFTKATNWYHGIQVTETAYGERTTDVSRHAIKIGSISIGQETDIESHYQKYLLWREKHPNNKLILYGVSRGAATTFNALAKYKYPETKLVILEGCFHSFDDVVTNWVGRPLASLIHKGLSLFTKYKENGPAPGKAIADIPENIPFVFITSKIDRIVPSFSTEKLAYELAARGKNPVYLLKLERSSHPNYMFDNEDDRSKYECFIHAIYQKYGFPCNLELAKRGQHLLEECLLNKAMDTQTNEKRSVYAGP